MYVYMHVPQKDLDLRLEQENTMLKNLIEVLYAVLILRLILTCFKDV